MSKTTKAKEPKIKAEAKPETGTLARRRVNRGSTRRIRNALTAFDTACAAFIKEMDLQFYEADDEGNRTGEWEFVKHLKKMREGVTQEVNAQIHPAQPEAETSAADE